jgi:hypothetical protein
MQISRKKQELSAKFSTSVWMQSGEGIHTFIKHYVSGDVYSASGGFQAFEPFV